MPNWCYSEVELRCRSKKTADRLDKEFYEAFDMKDDNPADVESQHWLGKLLLHLGYSEKDIEKGEYSTRGSIMYYERNEKVISFSEETAWAPMLQVVKRFVDEYADNIDIKFYAEEPGCDIFCSNIREHIGKYRVDIWEDYVYDALGLTDDTYTMSEDDLKKCFKKALGYRDTDKVSFDTLYQEFRENIGDDLSINKIESCTIDELE